ncbi:DUF7309 domain-containing protein [Serpentinicella alkaliphila]|uniref:Uncharacterized protein n=1 Tax=Serpentinicella alkaliphila TaxID=1734049 RepID=A0A4R2TB99_9FIRM|nr:hypothetical protein [Serpentinicella alkaliphila]QUH25067.1 hypothetical protein HZR23_04210 [Serpentinicella alkaliphila]TCQ00488.1 hypothetical protein EDD79_10315 [Serpentinicella alkaliphila]
MKTREFTKEEAIELFEAAKGLNKIKPSEWIEENEVFGIKLPNQKGILFCSVLGKNKEAYGIELYEGAHGIESYFKLVSKRYDLEEEKIYIKKCIRLTFEDRKAISKDDYELIKLSEVIFRGKNQWPKFEYLEPGFVPRGLTTEELFLMTDAIKAVKDCCLYLKINKDKTGLVKKNKCYVREYDSNNNFKEVVVDIYEDILADLHKDRVIPKLYNDFDLNRLKSISSVTNKSWEIDFFYSFIPDGGENPYYPAILLIADVEKGVIIGSHTAHPNNMIEEFQSFILSFIDKNKEIPSKITMSNIYLLISQEELFRGLNVILRPTTKLNLIPIIKQDYFKLLVNKKLVEYKG